MGIILWTFIDYSPSLLSLSHFHLASVLVVGLPAARLSPAARLVRGKYLFVGVEAEAAGSAVLLAKRWEAALALQSAGLRVLEASEWLVVAQKKLVTVLEAR